MDVLRFVQSCVFDCGENRFVGSVYLIDVGMNSEAWYLMVGRMEAGGGGENGGRRWWGCISI